MRIGGAASAGWIRRVCQVSAFFWCPGSCARCEREVRARRRAATCPSAVSKGPCHDRDARGQYPGRHRNALLSTRRQGAAGDRPPGIGRWRLGARRAAADGVSRLHDARTRLLRPRRPAPEPRRGTARGRRPRRRMAQRASRRPARQRRARRWLQRRGARASRRLDSSGSVWPRRCLLAELRRLGWRRIHRARLPIRCRTLRDRISPIKLAPSRCAGSVRPPRTGGAASNREARGECQPVLRDRPPQPRSNETRGDPCAEDVEQDLAYLWR